MTKNEILTLVEKKLQSNQEELQRSLADYEDAANMDEGDTLDPEDFSRQAEFKEMQLRMKVQLDQIDAQLARLGELMSKKTSSIEPGAIIETKHNLFYIGISFSGIPVDGKELLGISTETPVYAVLKGKKEGDTFKMGKEEYSIIGIY